MATIRSTTPSVEHPCRVRVGWVENRTVLARRNPVSPPRARLGRLHRYLIHHVLAERGFNPPGVVFPVSAAILDRIADYRVALEDY